MALDRSSVKEHKQNHHDQDGRNDSSEYPTLAFVRCPDFSRKPICSSFGFMVASVQQGAANAQKKPDKSAGHKPDADALRYQISQ